MPAPFSVIRALYSAAVADPNLAQQMREQRDAYALEIVTDPTAATVAITSGSGNGIQFGGAVAMTRGDHLALLSEVIAWLDRGIAPTSRVRSVF
jgi:hypothetical protein